MTLTVLDPTHETSPVAGRLAPRAGSLAGATVGVISNGKEGTKGFFRHLDEMLRTELGVAGVVVRVKSSYSAPADPEIMAEARAWDAVVTGIGD